MMLSYGDNIHTVKIKVAVMKGIAAALVVSMVLSLLVAPIIAGFAYTLGYTVATFVGAVFLNLFVVPFGVLAISDLPEGIGRIKAYEEQEAAAKQREADRILADYERRRNNP